ncbi:restriction endonuclease subunit M [Raoultibacter phocaeensis]|uniref:restriction endonuclease subunit M n=1 Tax=Raoultibacter phocaeensis TaxID=2479841 RepID=UPI00111A63C9|nr:restriction endonuclease subunit M [Raoultibacter phocaeensis]
MTIPISDVVELTSGTPQFRIQESFSDEAPVYILYGQPEMDDDLNGLSTVRDARRSIRTFDRVSTVNAGDVIFSLISGKATVVQENHAGYLFTQNFVVLIPSESIDAKYLVFMLNENCEIKRQLQSGQQGSAVLKYTIRQLSNLALPNLPVIEEQRIIGDLYFNQLKREALMNRIAANETLFLLGKIKEATKA